MDSKNPSNSQDAIDGNVVATRSQTVTDDDMRSLLQEIMQTQSLRHIANDNLNYLCHHGHKLQLKTYKTSNNNTQNFDCTLCKKRYNYQQCWQCNADTCIDLFICHGCAEMDKNSKLHHYLAAKLYEKIIHNETSSFQSTLDQMVNDTSVDYNFVINQWHAKDLYGHSLLTAASQHSNIEIVTALLKYKPNVDVQCTGDHRKGATPLWLACFNNNDAIAKLLIKNNANPNIFETTDNITTFMAAAFHGNITTIDLLMRGVSCRLFFVFFWSCCAVLL